MRSVVFLFGLWVVFLSANTYAKENKNLVNANYYYHRFEYRAAITYFEKVADALNDPLVYAHLADCYRLTNEPQQAAVAYEKAINFKSCPNTVKLTYGQLLMQLMKYDDAAKWLTEYRKTVKADRRVDNLISACASAPQVVHAAPKGRTTLLALNTDGSEFAPTMWMGRLVFAADTITEATKTKDKSAVNPYYNIYSVSCDDNGNCDNEFSKLLKGKKGSKLHTGPCTFSADGQQMFFTRSRYSDNMLNRKPLPGKDSIVLLEVMVASDYDSSKKEFGTITPFQFNSEDYSVAYAAMSPNGKAVVFSSNMPRGAGGADLYLSKKNRGNKWSKPQSLGNAINTEGEEVFPYWADDSTLYFSSDGHEGLGGLDVYRSKWNEATGTFSAPENTGTPINSSYDDISMAIFADENSAYFSSNRPAAKKGDNIYFFKK